MEAICRYTFHLAFKKGICVRTLRDNDVEFIKVNKALNIFMFFLLTCVLLLIQDRLLVLFSTIKF
jgi:hypothetical protein